MKYKIYQSSVKQKDREEFNRKLLKLIDNKETEKYGITGDDVYNAYTGDGGLHGLNRKDYDSYYTYSEEKKNIENGMAPITENVGYEESDIGKSFHNLLT